MTLEQEERIENIKEIIAAGEMDDDCLLSQAFEKMKLILLAMPEDKAA